MAEMAGLTSGELRAELEVFSARADASLRQRLEELTTELRGQLREIAQRVSGGDEVPSARGRSRAPVFDDDAEEAPARHLRTFGMSGRIGGSRCATPAGGARLSPKLPLQEGGRTPASGTPQKLAEVDELQAWEERMEKENSRTQKLRSDDELEDEMLRAALAAATSLPNVVGAAPESAGQSPPNSPEVGPPPAPPPLSPATLAAEEAPMGSADTEEACAAIPNAPSARDLCGSSTSASDVWGRTIRGFGFTEGGEGSTPGEGELGRTASSSVNVHLGLSLAAAVSAETDARALRAETVREARCGRLGALAVRLVLDWRFDYAVGVLVALNAVIAGIDVEQRASAARAGDAVGGAFAALRVGSALFCIIFAIELALRLFVHGLDFFTEPTWKWNCLDLLLVLLQCCEEIVALSTGYRIVGANVTFMRVLRFFSVVRVVRGVRTLRVIGELRTLVATMAMAMKALGWTIVLLAFVIYIMSIWLTHLVSRLREHAGDGHLGVAELEPLYGSLWYSGLSLFQAITGGIDWQEAMTPLVKHVSPLAAPVFVLYILFSVFALMNVVTGVVVDMGLRSAKDDMDFFMQSNVRELFAGADGGISGELTWDDFESRLDQDHMRAYFKAIDVDPSEARAVWRLLDLDRSGTVDAEEFLSGCLRLRGPAKAIDLALVLHEVRRLSSRLKALSQKPRRGFGGDVGIAAQEPAPGASISSFTMPWQRTGKSSPQSPSSPT